MASDLFPINDVQYSPNGKLLATATDDNIVGLWDAETGSRVTDLNEHTDSAQAVAFSPDGLTLASGAMDGTVRLWNVSTRRTTRTLKIGGGVRSLAYSPDGRALAAGSDKGCAIVWDAASGRELLRLDAGDGYVSSLCFDPAGRAWPWEF
jgi:WD40 repeat protein